MRRLSWGMLVAVLPVAGFAQDAVIRIEAKRGQTAASEVAAKWRAQFDDVVTFPLSGGWIGIALGPSAPDAANARLQQLKAAGRIPADSFVAVPGGAVTLSPVAAEGAAPGGETRTDEAQDGSATAPTAPPDAESVAAEPQAGTHIRLESLQGRPEAEDVLAKWRETFPEAALWRLPGGWFSVTIGPMEAATAQAWLSTFKAGDVLPRDAFTSETSELGEMIEAGEAPDLPAPGEAMQLPPLDEVQRALRWAGRYDGPIDGKSGPMTRTAIAAEVAAMRVSPDAGTAMHRLIERRAAWRSELGLVELQDDHTGLSLIAPMDKLQFDRSERSLSIYAPEGDSGAALILFSQPGGQQELLDLSGLVTALGWVPQPKRMIERGHVLLEGENSDHHGRAEGWVRDGRAEGFVLIWPTGDDENRARIAAEMADSLARFAPAANDQGTEQAAP